MHNWNQVYHIIEAKTVINRFDSSYYQIYLVASGNVLLNTFLNWLIKYKFWNKQIRNLLKSEFFINISFVMCLLYFDLQKKIFNNAKSTLITFALIYLRITIVGIFSFRYQIDTVNIKLAGSYSTLVMGKIDFCRD